MASWNFTTSAAAIAKAGANANTVIVASKATLAKWSDDVEGTINALTRIDWIANPPTVNFANFLSEIASCKIGNKIINYDMSGYTSRTEAQTMLDVNDNDADKNMNELKTKVIQEKMI